ncbi:uncharacterized protein LOC129219326 isoform X2 [Uloborus diversus]|uniref:uncharacterized protein LOC129219326 isoform X2 n=1 Tax=Uloborus diversus TaxID=327109 RepID=UPI002409B7A9|nr:uncharacterized protein LOC129219326 isoform X2 [Uloborus diversus]
MPHVSVGQWVEVSDGEAPPNAVEVGYDAGNIVYVARAKHEDHIIPGKFLPCYSQCYVPHDGKEHEYVEFEVLVDPDGDAYEWKEAEGSEILPNAVQGGTTADGEPLYIGRVMHNDAMCCGKVHPSDGVLIVPYGTEEHSFSNFEYLVVKSAEESVEENVEEEVEE